MNCSNPKSQNCCEAIIELKEGHGKWRCHLNVGDSFFHETIMPISQPKSEKQREREREGGRERVAMPLERGRFFLFVAKIRDAEREREREREREGGREGGRAREGMINLFDGWMIDVYGCIIIFERYFCIIHNYKK